MKQASIARPVKWTGIGLHSGAECTVTVSPADVNFGLKFRRIDLGEDGWIPADVKFVTATDRSTCLTAGGREVKTVEHLLAALHGMGIDNACIDVDGPEIPIMDGSGKPFVDALRAAGKEEQAQPKKIFELKEKIEYVDPNGSEYVAVPSDRLVVDVLVDFGSDTIGYPHANLDGLAQLNPNFSSARTFVYSHDVVELASRGLIKGGSIDNAVVIKSGRTTDKDLEEALLNLGKKDVNGIVQKINKGFELNSDNELARHKLFDLAGDLALLGANLKARIFAKKPGHTGNIGFAKMLKDVYSKELKLKGKPLYDPNVPALYSTTDIMGYIPHRYPFLLVDKIIELSDNHVVGVKNLTFNELLFQGHFPNNPIFPGVLQMEALAQTGGILALNTVEHPSNWDTYFLKMDNVKFKRKVVPGDTLILKMELLSPIRRGIVHMQGTAYVGNYIVSEGELTAQIIDRTTLK